jgi:phage tail-like protein
MPLGLCLPAVYQGDDLTQRMTAGFDRVLAPIFATLDCFGSYLDPRLAPADFVEWLADWVGLALDENWSPARQREVLAATVRLYGWRGTKRGISELVRLYTGLEPEIVDSGGVSWSQQPDGQPPDSTEQAVQIRISAGAAAVDLVRLDAVVAAAIPAHVRHEIVVPGADVARADAPKPSEAADNDREIAENRDVAEYPEGEETP